jgi:hypothetical protein
MMAPNELLLSALALVLASIAFALTLSTVPVETDGRRYVTASLIATLGIVVVVPLMVAGLVRAGAIFDGILGGFTEALSTLLPLGLGLFGFSAIVAVIVVTRRAFQLPFAVVGSSAIALILLGTSIVPLILYTEVDSLFEYNKVAPMLGAIVISIVSLGFIIRKLVKFISRRTKMAVILTASAMMSVIALVFFIWISGTINLSLAKFASIALVWAIAALLYTYTRNIWQNQPKPPIDPPSGNGNANHRAVYPVRLSKDADKNRRSPCPTTPYTTPPSTSPAKPPS